MKPPLPYEVRILRPGKTPFPMARFCYMTDAIAFLKAERESDPDLTFQLVNIVHEEPRATTVDVIALDR